MQDNTIPPTTDEKQESLLTFPCQFPIKIMGQSHAHFQTTMVELLLQHDPEFDASTITTRESSKGSYLGLGVVVNATSQEHLDNIYRALTAHEMVKVVL